MEEQQGALLKLNNEGTARKKKTKAERSAPRKRRPRKRTTTQNKGNDPPSSRNPGEGPDAQGRGDVGLSTLSPLLRAIALPCQSPYAGQGEGERAGNAQTSKRGEKQPPFTERDKLTCYSPSLQEQEAAMRAERAYWTQWVIRAAEKERERRLRVLAEMQQEEERERLTRRAWAINAIEEERRAVMREMFLNNLTNSPWFQASVSAIEEDYEVVCPNFGCDHSCRRNKLHEHVAECPYGLEESSQSGASSTDFNTYEVICPNAVLGCVFTCSRTQLPQHMEECAFQGKSQEEEQKIRTELKQRVLEAVELERQRRMEQLESNEDEEARGLLHRLWGAQTRYLQGILHYEIQDFAVSCVKESYKREALLRPLIRHLEAVIKQLWPAAKLEPFGSFVTGMCTSQSDIDLVICGAEEAESLGEESSAVGASTAPSGPKDKRLRTLSEQLRQSCEWIEDIQTIETATIPLVKVRTKADPYILQLDISFDGPRHNGIATASLLLEMKSALPALSPLVLLLKEFLARRGLNDTYTGGLSSYALVLMVTYLLLTRRSNRSTFSQPQLTSPSPSSPILPRKDSIVESNSSVFPKVYGPDLQRSQGQRLGSLLLHGGPVAQQGNSSPSHVIAPPTSVSSSASPARPSFSPASEDQQAGEPPTLLGQLLMEFLRFYGDEFQPMAEGLSVRNGGFRFLLSPSLPGHPSEPLTIEDPFDPNNNVARHCYRISQILQSFGDALSRLNSFIARGKRLEDLHLSVLETILQVSTPIASPPSTSSGEAT